MCRNLLLFFSILFTLLLMGGCAKSPSSETSLLQELDITPTSGQVPELVLQSLDGSRDISISSYRGNLVVLSVWVSWCKYCQQEAPYVAELIERAKQVSNIKIIGLTVDKDRDSALQHVQKYRLTNPIMHDEGGNAINKTILKIRGTPTTFYIAPSGRILGKVEGYIKFNPEQKLEKLIELARVVK